MSVAELFEPLTLRHGPTMRNRFMLAPLTNQQSERDGAVSKFDQSWMEQLAQSGYALIQTGAATVEASGIAYERQLGIHSDEHLYGLTQMATAIRDGGGISAVQLHHAGHRASPELGGVPAPASSLTLPYVVLRDRVNPSYG
ncbi:oxidoreductase [Streptomyces phaeochromogenes]